MRPSRGYASQRPHRFQSTHPVRGATIFSVTAEPTLEFQSTHPVRGATEAGGCVVERVFISIHAPREGCDPGANRPGHHLGGISIHAPREGCDVQDRRRFGQRLHISIHAPREGCDCGVSAGLVEYGEISIHAPREGCDPRLEVASSNEFLFQSTHPVRGATVMSNAR